MLPRRRYRIRVPRLAPHGRGSCRGQRGVRRTQFGIERQRRAELGRAVADDGAYCAVRLVLGDLHLALDALAEYLPLLVTELRVWRGAGEAIIVPETVIANDSLDVAGPAGRVAGQERTRDDWMDEATYQRLPDTLTLRELRVHAPRKCYRTRVITVVTTLLNPHDFPKADIAELYRLRWHAELDLRSLKQTLQMDVLRGKTPAIVQKELWAHLLVYNLIRKVMAQAAAKHGLDPRTLSFKGALQTLNAFALPLLTCAAPSLLDVIDALLEAIVRHRVGNRPGRFDFNSEWRWPYGRRTTTFPFWAGRSPQATSAWSSRPKTRACR